MLPQTVTDAMEVTKIIGERYLCVDSLCVVQDDPVEVSCMIKAMDKIFKAATLTIIVGDGKYANAGLAGVRPGSRNIQSVTGLVEGIGVASAETRADILDPGGRREAGHIRRGCFQRGA